MRVLIGVGSTASGLGASWGEGMSAGLIEEAQWTRGNNPERGRGWDGSAAAEGVDEGEVDGMVESVSVLIRRISWGSAADVAHPSHLAIDARCGLEGFQARVSRVKGPPWCLSLYNRTETVEGIGLAVNWWALVGWNWLLLRGRLGLCQGWP